MIVRHTTIWIVAGGSKIFVFLASAARHNIHLIFHPLISWAQQSETPTPKYSSISQHTSVRIVAGGLRTICVPALFSPLFLGRNNPKRSKILVCLFLNPHPFVLLRVVPFARHDKLSFAPPCSPLWDLVHSWKTPLSQSHPVLININNEMPKTNIKCIPMQHRTVIVHVCFALFIVWLYICVCECLLQNNNHKIKA